MTDIDIRLTRYGAPVARALVAAAMADLGSRYGGSGDETPIGPVEFDPPNGTFLIAWRGDSAVGCVGWRSHDETDDVAELKRLYVDPAARGTGIAAALLTAVEDSARLAGRTRMILECGDLQPEAVALYRRSGYARIENFGFYRDSPRCLSFGRELGVAAGIAATVVTSPVSPG